MFVSMGPCLVSVLSLATSASYFILHAILSPPRSAPCPPYVLFLFLVLPGMPLPIDSLANSYFSFLTWPWHPLFQPVFPPRARLFPLCSVHTSSYLRGCFLLEMGQWKQRSRSSSQDLTINLGKRGKSPEAASHEQSRQVSPGPLWEDIQEEESSLECRESISRGDSVAAGNSGMERKSQ